MVITIWTTYACAALVASGVFIFAGWHSRKIVGQASARRGYDIPNDPLWTEAEPDLTEDNAQADAGAALRLVLKRLAPLLASHSIQMEVAISSGLLVRMRGAVLADLLEEVLVVTLHAVPASRLLLTTAARGEHVAISITDDVPGANPDVRRAGMRALIERVAMRGGALDVDVRPNEGTTTTLRFAAARDRRSRPRPDEPSADAEPAPPAMPISCDTNR